MRLLAAILFTPFPRAAARDEQINKPHGAAPRGNSVEAHRGTTVHPIQTKLQAIAAVGITLAAACLLAACTTVKVDLHNCQVQVMATATGGLPK